MKKTVLQNIEDLLNGQSLLEISKILQRLHEKYSKEYEIVCLENFDVVGYR